MPKLAFGILVLFAAAIQDQREGPPKTIHFAAPEGTKEADLKKAAAALQSRCEAWGWQGMKAEVITKDGKTLVCLSCESGFQPPNPGRRPALSMAQQAARLAYVGTLTSFELRIVHRELTKPESEQFQARQDPANDTSPKGTSWVRFHALNQRGSDPTIARLLFDEPVFRSGTKVPECTLRKLKPKVPTNRVFEADLTQAGIKSAGQAIEKIAAEPRMVLLLDGKIFHGDWPQNDYKFQFGQGARSAPKSIVLSSAIEYGENWHDDTVVIVLLVPSPVPLNLVDSKK